MRGSKILIMRAWAKPRLSVSSWVE